MTKPNLQCRFYENEFPATNEMVMTKVKRIQPMGAYVHLLEYNNAEGMIMLSEISRRRIRSLNKLLKINRDEIVMVIRVDTEKKYIDLSKRQRVPEDVKLCEENFANAKLVNQILRRVSELLGFETDEEFEDLYRRTAWYFDRKYNKRNAAYDVFNRVVMNSQELEECDISDEARKLLLNNIRLRMMPQTLKIRADFSVSCFKYKGIDSIKVALRAGEAVSDEIEGEEGTQSGEKPSEPAPGGSESSGQEDHLLSIDSKPRICINLIAAPQFVMTCQTMNRQKGLDLVELALKKVEESIVDQGGSFKLDSAAHVVADQEDAELKKRMEELTLANQEVSADEDSDEDDDEGDSNEDDEAGDKETIEEDKSDSKTVVNGDK